MDAVDQRACPYCDGAISQSASKCQHCGEWVKCPACASDVQGSARFCASCGAYLPAASTSTLPASALGAAPTTPTIQSVGAPTLPYPPQARPYYAGFWRRFAAVLIDAIILLIPLIILFVLAAAARASVLDTPLAWIGQWLYFALMESSEKQATLGKQALGIIVTDYRGQRISFGRATGRFFAKIVSGLLLGIGYIMAGFTERKQALHDMMASTLVINRSQEQGH